MKKFKFFYLLIIIVGFMLPAAFPGPVQGQERVKKSKGQKILIPIHPQIFIDDRGATIELTTTLMVYNTDPAGKVELASIKFYDPEGKMIKEHLAGPRELAPLSSFVLLIQPLKMKKRGPGSIILLEWSSRGKPVNSPLIEGVSIGAQGNQGISFHNNGIIVTESD